MKGLCLCLILLLAGLCPGQGGEAELQRLAARWQPVGAQDEWQGVSELRPGLMQAFTLVWLQYWAKGEDPPPLPEIPSGCRGERAHREVAAAAGTLRTCTLRLRPTRPGSLALGAALEIYVPSLLEGMTPRDAIEAPEAILPAPPAAFSWQWPAAALGILLLALGGLRLVRARARMPTAVPLSPHAEAQRALRRLAQLDLQQESEVERFYLEVSATLRRYLEARFGMLAPRRHTEEFLQSLERDPRLPPPERQRLAQFLHRCDLVKFARLLPGPEVHAETLRIAEGVVEATREDLRPAVEEVGA